VKDTVQTIKTTAVVDVTESEDGIDKDRDESRSGDDAQFGVVWEKYDGQTSHDEKGKEASDGETTDIVQSETIHAKRAQTRVENDKQTHVRTLGMPIP
jgi:hypothetical protein